MSQDPYSILGLSRHASLDEVKRRYRDLAKKYHPDRYADPYAKEMAEEKMQAINTAYDQITSGNIPHVDPPEYRAQSQRERQSQSAWGQQQGPAYYGRNPGCSTCDALTCLCCADSCCECLGGDLVPCC